MRNYLGSGRAYVYVTETGIIRVDATRRRMHLPTGKGDHMFNSRVRWPVILAALTLIVPAVAMASENQLRTLHCLTFQETGKTTCDPFSDYWESHGGLAQQGFPISDVFQERSDSDDKEYTVQYFERAVMEIHPENQPPNDVLLQLLGSFLYRQKYPNGAPNQQPNTSPGSVLFNETGKRLGGGFLLYWRSHGGLAQQGYPISDEFVERSETDGKEYTVQYFERAVMEYHPENEPPNDVLLSLLGSFRYQAKYPPPTPTPTRTPAPTPTATPITEVGVDIVDFYFGPRVVTITVGMKVTWNFLGPTVHNTVHRPPTGSAKLWESPLMERRGQKFTYNFTQRGVYDYWCTIHPEMTGQVVVR
jgi:plastocyanin